MDGRLPNFLIVGAMRCGTTSLARSLGAHPQVYVAEQKEVRYFDLRRDRGLDWYATQFDAAGDALAVGEATQTYLYDPAAQDAMAAALPAAKLIAILRNPVDRAYSHYWLNRERGREPLVFEEALAAERERLAGGGLRERYSYSYVDRGRYVHQLTRLEGLYPRAQIHVILLEDLRADPKGTYAAACTYLGVDPGITPPSITRPINEYRRVRSPALRRFGKKMPSVVSRAIARVNSTAADYRPLDAQTRTMLEETFEEDRVHLATWLGRDLDVWKKDGPEEA